MITRLIFIDDDSDFFICARCDKVKCRDCNRLDTIDGKSYCDNCSDDMYNEEEDIKRGHPVNV